MGFRHHYKTRDFGFAQRLFLLRKRTGLTQDALALRLEVAEKSIRNWEGGNYYPSDQHLRNLIELYLYQQAFEQGREEDEIRALWDQVRENAHARNLVFDEQWFAALLDAWRARTADQASPPDRTPLQPPTPLAPPTQGSHLPAPSRLLQGDWGAALDVSEFYGRSVELATLARWILVDRCRLVALLGMGGVGKTALAARLAQQAVDQFDCVLWRSVQNAPSLEDVLRDWLPVLMGPDQSLPSLQDEEFLLDLLLSCLRERRCLLVLDNLETLFQEGELEGRYRAGYEGYARLIQRIAQTVHQSCLLLTSRERFSDLGVFSGSQAPVRELSLTGLGLLASQEMLQNKDLFGSQQDWSELVQSYAGNPLALKIVAEMVHELFGGDVAAFVSQGLTSFHGIRQLLNQHFERLSALEQTIMYWLAIERQFTPLEAIKENVLPAVSPGVLLEALHSLRNRGLVERGGHGAIFTLQPVILEYMSERLARLMTEEIVECQPRLLLTHALVKARAKDYLRTSQSRFTLQPLLAGLLARFGTESALEAHLEGLLQHLRGFPRSKQGYGGGNVVNLLIGLNGHLKGKDCSHLALWQVNLQEAEAQDASFVGSDLADSAFMDTMDAIMSVALSANGAYMVAGSSTGEIRLWRVDDDQPLWVLPGHQYYVWALAFHPESRLLASGGYDGLVKVWDLESGQCVRTLRGHTAWVRGVAIHPAGGTLATGSHDGSVRLWDLSTGDCLRTWSGQGSGVWSVAFSPDGHLLAGGLANGVVNVWASESGQHIWSDVADAHSGINSLAFSPDGRVLVGGESDGGIDIWGAEKGVRLSTLFGQADVFSVAFSTEGLLASGSLDGAVKIWQAKPGEDRWRCLVTLQGHTSTVWSLAWGPGGLLASSSQDGLVKLWQNSREEGGVCLKTLRGHSRAICPIDFSPDGKLLCSGESGGAARLWEIQSGQCLSVLSRHAGRAYGQAFSCDGRLLAKGLPEGTTIKVWDVNSRREVKTLSGHRKEIWALAFSPDGRFLASGSFDATVKVWDMGSGHCLATLEGHNNWICSLSYNPDSTLLASGDLSGVVRLWRLNNGQCLHTMQGSHQAIAALTFTPDGTLLLSCNEQDLINVWSVQSGACLKRIPGVGDTYWLRSVAFSPDASLLATVSRDQSIKIWDTKSGELLHTIPHHALQPHVVAWSSDQRLLASGTDDGAILLWDWQSGQRLQTLRSDRPYERMDIRGVTGITEAQRASLKALGAIDQA